MAGTFVKVATNLFRSASTNIIRHTVTVSAAPSLISKRSFSNGVSQDIMASRLDSVVHQRYMDLDTSGHIMATYVWIDGSNVSLWVCACGLIASVSVS